MARGDVFDLVADQRDALDTAFAAFKRDAARIDNLTRALQRIADTFDENWLEGSVERQVGDIARAAIREAKRDDL